MHRKLEPELMDDQEQVKAYAEADFSEPHSRFIELVSEHIPPDFSGNALDLGCGPGDITCRFARQFPKTKIDAVDGSKTMLNYGEKLVPSGLFSQINFIHAKLPFFKSPGSYELIFSNSLLHHLPDPQVLWQTIKQCASNDASVVVMDLLRPENTAVVQNLVEEYAADEPEILRRDFCNSLLAAFTLDEIKLQLTAAQLNFAVNQISDRHVLITGKIT